MSATVMRLRPSEIDVPDGRRELDEVAVRKLAKSIKEIGLQHPISVRQVGGRFHLIAGLHRLEAAKLIGEEYIDAAVMKVDAVDARLWEISENLHRADLTVSQRASQIAEWVKLTDEKRVSRQVVGKPFGGRPEGGAAAASREFGLGEREVQRAIKIDSMADEAKEEASRLGLDNNQSALLRASQAPTATAQIISLRAHIEPKSDDDVIRQQADSIISAWNKACPQARQLAMETLDRPIMDGRYA